MLPVPQPRNFNTSESKSRADFTPVVRDAPIIQHEGPLKRIKFILSLNGGGDAVITYPIETINVIAYQFPESYFDSILKGENTDEELSIDLKTFDVKSFMYLMRCVEPHKNGKFSPAILTDDIDVTQTKILAAYLYFNQKIIDHLSIEVKDLFFKNLNDTDKIMVEDDRKLREYLFANENEDLRYIDATYTLKNMMEVYSQLIPDSNIWKYVQPYRNDKIYFNRLTRYSTIAYTSTIKYDNYGQIETLDRKVLSTGIGDNYQHFINGIRNVFNDKTENILSDYLRRDHPFFGKFAFAGGLINAFLTDLSEAYYKHSDVDIFFTTKDPEEATQIMISMINSIRENSDFKLMYRTPYAVSVIYAKYNKDLRKFENHITFQFILRLYNSVTQIIAPFDIDACACAFTGGEIYVMPRYLRAVNNGYILVDPERQSKNYTHRLYKYLSRGFDLALPGYFADRDVHNQGKKVTGLAKIINFFRENSHVYPASSDDISDYGGISMESIYSMSWKWFNQEYNKKYGITFLDKLRDDGIKDEQKRNIAIRNYMLANNVSVPFIGTKYMDKLLTGEYETDISSLLNDELELAQNEDHKVRQEPNFLSMELPFKSSLGPITFITKNPGSQLTNSFNPTTEDWYRDVYVYREEKHLKLPMFPREYDMAEE
jgi:hypothetical protein